MKFEKEEKSFQKIKIILENQEEVKILKDFMRFDTVDMLVAEESERNLSEVTKISNKIFNFLYNNQ